MMDLTIRAEHLSTEVLDAIDKAEKLPGAYRGLVTQGPAEDGITLVMHTRNGARLTRICRFINAAGEVTHDMTLPEVFWRGNLCVVGANRYRMNDSIALRLMDSEMGWPEADATKYVKFDYKGQAQLFGLEPDQWDRVVLVKSYGENGGMLSELHIREVVKRSGVKVRSEWVHLDVGIITSWAYPMLLAAAPERRNSCSSKDV